MDAGERAIQQLVKKLPNNRFQVFQEQIKLSLIKQQQIGGDNSALQTFLKYI
jgi:DNA polymerase III delta subunit